MPHAGRADSVTNDERGSHSNISDKSSPKPITRVIKVTLPICNTSGVLNTKTRHAIICIAHHSCVSENFDMHTLKQVYLYVICVDLYGLN